MAKCSGRAHSGCVNQFWYALEYNDMRTIRHMINHGMNVNHIFKQPGHQRHGQTPIFIAVSKNNKDLAECLIQAGCNLDQPDMYGETPLCVAVRRGKMSMVKQLVAADCKINQQNNRGENALFLTIRFGRKDLADFLVSAGIDVDAVNRDGSSPLLLALELLSDTLSCNARHATRRRAPSNMADIAEQLIPLCSNLNYTHPNRGSALRMALAMETAFSPGDLKLSKLLLQHGAIPDRLFFLRFGGLHAATTKPGSEFFTREFFDLALQAGAYLQREKTWLLTVLHEMPQELQPYEALFTELLEKAMNPTSLQVSCLMTVRQILGGQLWTKIDQLPLPIHIKDYLKLKL